MTTFPPGDWRNNPGEPAKLQRVAILNDASLRLDAPNGRALLGGRLATYLCQNCYWDGANFWRYDATKPASLVKLDNATQALQLFTVAAGTGAITWTQVAQVGADSGWLAAPYAANWSDFGPGASTGGYKKDALGVVRLKGLVKKAVALVANDTILTLPAGYRPATTRTYAVPSAAGYTAIQVNTAGAVFVLSGGSATWIGLDGFAFDPAV